MVSTSDDVLEMSEVECGNVYVFDSGWEWGGWNRRLGLGLINHVVTVGVWDVCMGFGGVGGVGDSIYGWLSPEPGRVGDVMSVCVVSLDYLCR